MIVELEQVDGPQPAVVGRITWPVICRLSGRHRKTITRDRDLHVL